MTAVVMRPVRFTDNLQQIQQLLETLGLRRGLRVRPVRFVVLPAPESAA